MSYFPYHMHTMYSIMDGISTSEQYAQKASEMGIKTLGITDHGNCHGWIDHTRACLEHDIKPVIGIEAYVWDERDGATDRGGHCVILVMNKEGYHNLLYLIDKSYSYQYFNPRIPVNLLFKHNAGLMVTSACRGGIFSKMIIAEPSQDPHTRYIEWLSVFGDRLKGEIQPPYNDIQKVCNDWIRTHFANESNIVCATDSHYLTKGDNKLQSAVRSMIIDKFEGYEDYYHMWLYDELVSFNDVNKRYVDNTLIMAEQCNFVLQLDNPKMPDVDISLKDDKGDTIKDEDGKPVVEDTYDTRLFQLAFAGLNKRLPGHGKVYIDRLDYELSVIRDNHTAPYLLMNHLIFEKMRSKGIVYGPRGSACGSLVAYCLFLHDIDPIEHRIMFERFMTPGRKSLPDIDYDFYTPDRDKAFQVLRDEFGDESVSRITTFTRLRLKSALQKIGKAYEIDKEDIKFLSDLVKYKKPGDDTNEDEANLDAFTQLCEDADKKKPCVIAGYRGKGPNYISWLDNTQRLCELDLPSTHGIHACGCVVVSKGTSISGIWPVLYQNGMMAVQYDMSAIEAAGGVKMDFLGLSSLYPINVALRSLELKPAQIPLDDPEVYRFIRRDSMVGLFQAKNFSMKQLIRDINPTQLSDLALAIAAFRPAVLKAGLDKVYVERKNIYEAHKLECMKNGTYRENLPYPEVNIYPHPDLESVLRDTFGVFIYQDHILGACKTIGMSDLEADKVRKATAKKKPEEVAKLYELFNERATQKGWSQEVIANVWSVIEAAAGYGFNFSHALTYARWLYISAWIKLYYPEMFFTASLTARQSAGFNEDEGNLYRELLVDCRRNSPGEVCLQLQPPDINNASHEFIYNEINNTITFSLAAVKNINADVALWFKKHGPFYSLQEVLDKMESTSEILEDYYVPDDKIVKKSLGGKLTLIGKSGSLKELNIIVNNMCVTMHRVCFINSLISPASYAAACVFTSINMPKTRHIVTLNHIDSLIRSGAMDIFGDRREMLKSLFWLRKSTKSDALFVRNDRDMRSVKFAVITDQMLVKPDMMLYLYGAGYFELLYNTIYKICFLTKHKHLMGLYKSYMNLCDKLDLADEMYKYCGFNTIDYGGDLFMDVPYGGRINVIGKIKNVSAVKTSKIGNDYRSFIIDTSSGEINCMIFDKVESYDTIFKDAEGKTIGKGKKVSVTGKKQKDNFNKGKQMITVFDIKEGGQ